MTTLAIYTVLTGDKEPLGNPIGRLQSIETDLKIEFICFTDNPNLKSNVWNCRVFDTHCLPPEKSSRRPKALPHEYLADYDYSLYMDNICELKRLPTRSDLETHTEADYVYRLFKHSTRNFIIEEALAIASLGYERAESLIRQLDAYSEHIAQNEITPISTATVILRSHLNASVKRHGISWWEHILAYSKRDQMSFDFCRLIKNIKVNYFPGNKFDNDLIFEHSNQSANRKLANVDRMMLKLYESSVHDSVKNTNNLAARNGNIVYKADELELISFLTGASLGHFHAAPRNLAQDLQEVLGPHKNKISSLVGIYKKYSAEGDYTEEEFIAAQKSLTLFLNPKQSLTDQVEPHLEISTELAIVCHDKDTLVCLYNFRTVNEFTDKIHGGNSLNQEARFILMATSRASYMPNVVLAGSPRSQERGLTDNSSSITASISPGGNFPNLIFCDGGLSNRLYAVIFGLILRKRYGYEWQLLWPRTQWCDADFKNLFELSMDINSIEFAAFKEAERYYTKLIHQDFVQFSPDNIVLHSSIATFEEYKSFLDRGPVMYLHNSLPPFVDINHIAEVIHELKPRGSIAERVSTFVIANNISRETFGLHIRKTDFGNSVKEGELFEFALKSKQRFFVCSDSQDVLSQFAKLKNCVVSPSKTFPKKIFEHLPWGAMGHEESTDEAVANIYRDRNSVEDALIDLLILSRTNIMMTSGSSFLRLAKIFSIVSPEIS
jgi:hypothetical protein